MKRWIPPIPKRRPRPRFQFSLQWLFYVTTVASLAVISLKELWPELRRMDAEDWFLSTLCYSFSSLIISIQIALAAEAMLTVLQKNRSFSLNHVGVLVILLTPAWFVFWFVAMSTATSENGLYMAGLLGIACLASVFALARKWNL